VAVTLVDLGAPCRHRLGGARVFCEVFDGGGQAAALPLGVLDGLP